MSRCSSHNLEHLERDCCECVQCQGRSLHASRIQTYILEGFTWEGEM